jgi:segregation and condensation protein B
MTSCDPAPADPAPGTLAFPADDPAASEPAVAEGPAPTQLGLVTPEHVRAVEAIVLVATQPVEARMLAQLLELPVVQVEAVLHRLAAAYDEAGHGFQLAHVAGGWRFQTHPSTAAYVERFVLDGQSARLSAAALETLAVVAYRQPISRAQVAAIRGVDPDGALRTLAQRGYIAQVGRDAGPGQAVLWGTTSLFLERLGLASLDDLPPVAQFVPDGDVVEALEATLRPEGA